MKDKNRLKTGIEGLDNMLNGGLIPERPYIVSGPCGSGKTTLCMQFLLEGLSNDENVLFTALEEPVNEISSNMRSLGLDVDGVDILDANSDIRRYEPSPIMEISSKSRVEQIRNVSKTIRKSPRFKSTVVTVHSLQITLQQKLRRTSYTRIVIDSITALKFFCMSGEEDVHLQSFLRFLSESRITCMLAAETPQNYALTPEMFLARGEIRLHKFREKGRIKRQISIEKFRGSRYDESTYPLSIVKGKGVVVMLPP